jgi:TusA-related sulfurtransferase
VFARKDSVLPPREIMDLRGVPCPQNAARVVMRLATMDAGELLAVLLDAGEPAENVPAALDPAESRIIAHACAAGVCTVTIQRLT